MDEEQSVSSPEAPPKAGLVGQGITYLSGDGGGPPPEDYVPTYHILGF